MNKVRIYPFSLSILMIVVFSFNLSAQTSQSGKMEGKPNVIIILVDDLGYNDVGFNGCQDIPTPNIDRIATNGVKFTEGYVSNPVCGPSRAGLITGRYQDRFGFGRNPLFAPNDINQGLPLSEETLATVLKREGYHGMAIGKWHLGGHKDLRPLKRGFDEFFGFLTGGHYYFPEDWVLNDLSELTNQYSAYKTKLLKNDSRIDETEYLTDALSREAVNFVSNKREEPFFLYLAYNAPHTPLQATEKYLNRFSHIENKKRRTYAAMVSAVDDGVGQILDALENYDLAKNTMVYFLSDNGGPEKHNGSDNGVLREGKGWLYEGGIRVPFAMQWKGMIPAGVAYHKPVISLDIFATVSAAAKAKPKNKLDGVNLLPFLAGTNNATPHKTLYWRQFDKESYAVRIGDLKLVNADGNLEELFNLSKDTGELTNLINDNPKIKKKYSRLMEAWIKELKDPLFLGLSHDKQYNSAHPNRYQIEKY
ncbi:Arylsulfatase A [Zhouia amylolytica]|uniref:Arylsulfatase A n=1 Tax=Zhouia amylolytica TaxID=376730 RepID=A0A1I6RV74_9FLAO|nr:sulfatase-like hydrolase/transferase [Zhouia amylolytica]SFS68572.1 Arylsulfatase A [Zhouia amylolytica]